MRWHSEHVIAASIERVEKLLFDPETIAEIPRFQPLIEWAKIVKLEHRGNVVERVVHYRPSVDPPLAGKSLTRKDTEFFENLTWDLNTHEGTFSIRPNIPEQYQKFFRGGGRYLLQARSANETVRVIEGEIVFAVPMPVVGRIAEYFAVGKLKQNFSNEAALLQNRAARAA